MEAAWELGAWDVARAERPGCMRPGAPSSEALECLQAFGAFPFGINGNQVVVADAPDADELVQLAAARGYLMWVFRPVSGGIWADYADDATLDPGGPAAPALPASPDPAPLRRQAQDGLPLRRASEPPGYPRLDTWSLRTARYLRLCLSAALSGRFGLVSRAASHP